MPALTCWQTDWQGLSSAVVRPSVERQQQQKTDNQMIERRRRRKKLKAAESLNKRASLGAFEAGRGSYEV